MDMRFYFFVYEGINDALITIVKGSTVLSFVDLQNPRECFEHKRRIISLNKYQQLVFRSKMFLLHQCL